MGTYVSVPQIRPHENLHRTETFVTVKSLFVRLYIFGRTQNTLRSPEVTISRYSRDH